MLVSSFNILLTDVLHVSSSSTFSISFYQYLLAIVNNSLCLIILTFVLLIFSFFTISSFPLFLSFTYSFFYSHFGSILSVLHYIFICIHILFISSLWIFSSFDHDLPIYCTCSFNSFGLISARMPFFCIRILAIFYVFFVIIVFSCDYFYFIYLSLTALIKLIILINMFRRNLSEISTPSGMQTPRKSSADPTFSSTMRRTSRGTTPVDKKEPFRL